MGQARRIHKPLSVVALDPDDCKAINDEDGHTDGGRALICTANLSRERRQCPNREVRNSPGTYDFRAGTTCHSGGAFW